MADCSLDIVSRLGTSFDNATRDREKPDFLTRDIGGHFRSNQPYISGYFQTIFGVPEKLFGVAGQGQGAGATASKWLHSTCESFTPHTQTLNKADIQGQGQLGSSFPTSKVTTREFTMAFREYQNMPILKIIRRWASVFDEFTGVSPLRGNEFVPLNYKGWCAVIQTKPVRSQNESIGIQDIEECYIYQGVWPTNIPYDTASAADITGNDTVQLSVTWSFDGAPLTSAEPGVLSKVVSLLDGLKYMCDESTYGRYLNKGVGERTQPWGTHAAGDISSSTGYEPDIV